MPRYVALTGIDYPSGGGVQHAEPGETVDLNEQQAEGLLAIGAIRDAEASDPTPDPTPEVAEPEVVPEVVPDEAPVPDEVPDEVPEADTPEGVSAVVVEVFQGKNQGWYWHAIAGNGEIVADGGEPFATLASAKRSATDLFPEATYRRGKGGA